MTLSTRPDPDETGTVALIGVDNIPTRRLISSMGCTSAVDVGLGRGPGNYSSISMHAFSHGRRSEELPAWGVQTQESIVDPEALGLAGLLERYDECGVLALAGKAVGVPFVGMVAGALAVAEALSELNGGASATVRRVDLRSLDQAQIRLAGRTPADVAPTVLL